MRSLAVSCWTGYHKLKTFGFFFPCLAFFGILLPSLMSFRIRESKKRDILESSYSQNRFVNFIAPYRNQREYYGIFLIMLKIISVIRAGNTPHNYGTILTNNTNYLFYLIIYFIFAFY